MGLEFSLLGNALSVYANRIRNLLCKQKNQDIDTWNNHIKPKQSNGFCKRAGK